MFRVFARLLVMIDMVSALGLLAADGLPWRLPSLHHPPVDAARTGLLHGPAAVGAGGVRVGALHCLWLPAEGICVDLLLVSAAPAVPKACDR